MIPKDNYRTQAEQAKKRFLTYDQQELICRCALRYDEEYFYTSGSLTFINFTGLAKLDENMVELKKLVAETIDYDYDKEN